MLHTVFVVHKRGYLNLCVAEIGQVGEIGHTTPNPNPNSVESGCFIA